MTGAAVALAAVAALTLVVRRQWTVVRVTGDSMLPTLRSGDRLLARRHRRPRRGDVVVVHRPGGPVAVPAGAHAVSGETPTGRGEPLIKRVTALAGDRQPDGAVVPPGHVFVLSDNDGLDSRLFGPVPLTAVAAVVRRRLR